MIAHGYQDLPGWFDFAEVYLDQVTRARDGAHFVEVGTLFGKSAAFLAVEIVNSGKRITFDTIDSGVGVTPDVWKTMQNVDRAEDLLRTHGNLAAAAASCLAFVPGVVSLWSGDSLSAALRYPDRSLDFVFLDSSHEYTHVLAELAAWWPKVRDDGVLAGHDINVPGVRQAVQQWAARTQVGVSVIGTSWAVGTPLGQALEPGEIIAEYPRARFHATDGERFIRDRAADDALPFGWAASVEESAALLESRQTTDEIAGQPVSAQGFAGMPEDLQPSNLPALVKHKGWPKGKPRKVQS
jgi:predicted O-methyltransferase YrrM